MFSIVVEPYLIIILNLGIGLFKFEYSLLA
uniref:Uncharacterized protein n=1 Tax=Phage sp. ctGns7 TaxID=2828003 RepID=A0A8S5S972_9VIRU|nr:MAG TPA: hypothetical protein [Phage sp. ctGns7]